MVKQIIKCRAINSFDFISYYPMLTRVLPHRHDLGINLFHHHWHKANPFNGPLVGNHRRGESFYYMHQQLLARYVPCNAGVWSTFSRRDELYSHQYNNNHYLLWASYYTGDREAWGRVDLPLLVRVSWYTIVMKRSNYRRARVLTLISIELWSNACEIFLF